jgi:hypothetical protein
MADFTCKCCFLDSPHQALARSLLFQGTTPDLTLVRHHAPLLAALLYAPVLASDIASFATTATAAERQSHGKVRRKHAVKVEEVVQKFLAGAVPPPLTSSTTAPVTVGSDSEPERLVREYLVVANRDWLTAASEGGTAGLSVSTLLSSFFKSDPPFRAAEHSS